MDDLHLDRQVPHNDEAEQALLGSVLLDPESFSALAEALRGDEFYNHRHRLIFDAMLKLYADRKPTETGLVLDLLRSNGEFKSEDDAEYLVLLAEAASSISNPEYYIKIIKDAYGLRCTLDLCGELEQACFNREPFDEVVGVAQSRFADLAQGRQKSRFYELSDLAMEEFGRLKEMEQDTTGQFLPTKTGISDLDAKIEGFNKSNLIILGARPGVGKTSLALNIAYNIARSTQFNPKKSVVFFSLEMSREELCRRLISSAARVDNEKLKLCRLSMDDWRSVYDVWENEFRKIHFLVDESGNVTPTEMRARLHSVKNIGLIVIDYLQLMRTDSHTDNRVLEIADITRSLKLLAKELNVPILLLSQLSRGFEKRGDGGKNEDREPLLSDLRDSGAIEQDADVVLFIDRKTGEEDAVKKHQCVIYVAKNRHGSTGNVNLNWDGQFTSFTSLAKEKIPEGV